MDNDEAIVDEVVLYRSCPSNKSSLWPPLTVIDASTDRCMKNFVVVPHGMLVITRQVKALRNVSLYATFSPQQTMDPDPMCRCQVVNDFRCIVPLVLG